MFYRQSRDLENTRVEQTCERINYLLFVRILKAPICYSHGNLVKTFIKFKFCEYHCQNLVLILVKVKAWKLNSKTLELTRFETSMKPKFWTKSSANKIEFKTYTIKRLSFKKFKNRLILLMLNRITRFASQNSETKLPNIFHWKKWSAINRFLFNCKSFDLETFSLVLFFFAAF